MIKNLLFISIIALMVDNSYTKCRTAAVNDPVLYVSEMTDKFFGDIYKVLAKHEKGNLIFSPISLNMILTMVYLGAGGNTESQLSTSLRLTCEKDITAVGYFELINLLHEVQGVELNLANKIFISQKFKIEEFFNSKMEYFFESEVSPIQLAFPERAARDINNWYAVETKNQVNNLIKPNDIKDLEILLANAIYFKGDWVNKFDAIDTNPYPFFINRKTKKLVPMMFTEAEFYWGYINDYKSSFIELPYGNKTNSEIKMMVILPNLGVDIHYVEQKINHLRFAKFERSKSKVALHLPKFKIESSFDLKPILKEIGITEMFENSANFEGIVKNSNLKVSKVVQKAIIEVNEEGSKAGSASGLTMMSRERGDDFIVNRPFLCVILRKKFGAILFAARVMDPTAI